MPPVSRCFFTNYIKIWRYQMTPNAILFRLKKWVYDAYNKGMKKVTSKTEPKRMEDQNMFGLGKKKEKEAELLKLENIRLGCKPGKKEEVIREVGQILCDSGYVDENYIDAMLKRELTFATNIGNGIALPHGVEEAKKDIKSSGIAVMVFPEGTDWGGEQVKLVIGIAGVGEDHLAILATIADRLADPKDVDRITDCSKEEIYRIFTGKESQS